MILLFLAALAYPLYRTITQLLWSDGHFSFTAFAKFVSTDHMLSAIRDTLIVVIISAFLALIIGGSIAYLNERTDARMGAITDVLPFVPFLLPAVAGTIGWVLLLSPVSGYLNVLIRSILSIVGIHLTTGPFNVAGYPGLIFLYTINLVPFSFLMISAGIRNMDTQLEEQSRTCGAGPFRTAWRVVLPAIAPSIAGAFLLVVWFGFGLYSVPSVLAQGSGINIMSVQIVTLLTADFPPAYGPAIVLSLIMVGFVGVAWYAQTRILRRGRHSMVGGRARHAARASLGRWKWPVRALLMGYIGVVTILPPIALLLVAMSGFWNPDINWSHLSFAPFRQAIFDNPQTLLALKDSLGLATAGATIAMIAAGLVSVLVVRSRGKLLRTADGALKLPVIVSHVVLAIGFVLAFAGAPFNLGGSWLILCITYVVLFMPQGTLATDAAAGQVGRELTEASQISGGGDWRTFRKVFLPLMMPSLAAGWAMLFVFILGDLEVSSLLAGASNPTIGMQALSLYDQGGYADVAALALVLVVVSTVIVAAVFTLARRRSKWALAQTASTPVMF